MTLNERLSKICIEKKVKQLDLVKLGCGSKQTVNAIMNHKNKPSSQFLEAFLNGFKDINARWLITGEEEMLLEEPRTQYGYCKECIKKEGVIEYLRKELALRDKRIEELTRGADSQTDSKKEAS
jgi:transcriptional regulator with XRE-family HTH domain